LVSNASQRAQVRPLTLADAARAAELAKAIGWTQSKSDWERAIRIGEEGAVGIDQNGELAAVGVTTMYSQQRAWVGRVITHPDYQRRGHAKRIMEALMEIMDERGIREILLDASEFGQPLYEQLGFRPLYRIEGWSGDVQVEPQKQARLIEESDIPAVVNLDAAVFGAARPQVIGALLDSLPGTGWVDENPSGNRLSGFILVILKEGPYARIGPWVHNSPQGAERLFRTAVTALGAEQVRIDIPEQNISAKAIAYESNLRPQRQCVRMIYGDVEPAEIRVEDTYGIASFTWG